MAIAWRLSDETDWCLATDPALPAGAATTDTLGFVPAPAGADVTRFRLRPLSSQEYIAWAGADSAEARTSAAWAGVLSVDGEAVGHDALAGGLALALIALVIRLSEGSTGPFSAS